MIQKRTDKENAVSPVVGVMLMLVVTIIIASIVAAFAGGLFTSTSVTPQAAFKADVTPGTFEGWDHNPVRSAVVTFTHMGGDAISVNDIKFVFNLDGCIKTYDKSCEYISILPPDATAITTGDKIIYDAVKQKEYFNGVVYWSIIDKNTGYKIASGSIAN